MQTLSSGLNMHCVYMHYILAIDEVAANGYNEM